MIELPKVTFITGTDTGVGKTICTAAIAAALKAAGASVAVYKPTQAGTEAGEGDIDTVTRLAEITAVHEGIRLEHPMAPVAAAQRAAVTLPSAAQHVATIARLAAAHDHLLVEGAGGLLVELDAQGQTLAEIATATAAQRPQGRPAFVVVCRAALGTLNHTALTLEALERRGLATSGLVIGAWPKQPDAIETSNREYLSRLRTPLLGAIPAGAGQLPPARFGASAPGWFTPAA